jgi:hypothetical protein
MYSQQVIPAGAAKDNISLSAQRIGASPTAPDKKDETIYVKGLTRYMNIQKRGRESGPARIPQKTYIMMNMMLDKLDAISGLPRPAINICANELAKRKDAQITRIV